eukprot:CAMPEP_0115044944 /NCGR_PEP_ID=MMETSP0216-20121206/47842_1 /TAXON_ID=223996 /ORGANISM="Protocruzia adherens, Strain Boccale" /LENGTH=171 /DNA_ID=CAMNT_0002427705 /DNA_START=459 /DNA_END=974 /DNA_ORIENTATION=+
MANLYPEDNSVVDFFEVLDANAQAEHRNLIAVVEKLTTHPSLEGFNSLEEIYANLILVSHDLYLSQLEMALWWTMLEKFGFDQQFEFVRTLYATALAAKKAFNPDSPIDQVYVESNFAEGFGELLWSKNKKFDLVLWMTAATYSTSLPTFLNKNIDYNRVVDGFTREFPCL